MTVAMPTSPLAAPATRPLDVLVLGAPADAAWVDDVAARLRPARRARVRCSVADGAAPALRAAKEAETDVVVLPARARGAARLLRAAGHRTLTAGRLDPGGEDSLLAAAARAAGRPGAGLPPGPDVSVIVTVLDEAGGVDALVDAVSAQLRDGDELVVVDGGSRDGTRERLQERARTEPRLRVLAAPGTNISAGRNAGIAAAANEVIATTDVGCRPVGGWLDALRQAFAEEPAPGLAAGNCGVLAETALERAQALACYPDPAESRRPDALVRVYGRLFGQTFDPTLPFARSLAFTRAAWADAGGFPEALGWTEDGVFGRRIAERHPVVFAADALVWWHQRGTVRSTARMYHRYGRGAAESGERQLVVRDGVRALAYALAPVALARRRPAELALLGTGAAAYLSVPLRRAARARARPDALAAIPLALGLKDIGKVSGAVRTHARRLRDGGNRGRH